MNMVAKTFESLDSKGAGVISFSDVSNRFDVSMNPLFVQNRKSREELLNEFLNNFNASNCQITFQEYCDYYSDLATSIPSDEYFIRMMESTWQVPETEDEVMTKQTVQHLYSEVKARIHQLSKNDPALYRKIFNDFDTNGNGSLTIDEVSSMIAKLRISVERKYIYPFFKIIDADNSGCVEFEEFETYLRSWTL